MQNLNWAERRRLDAALLRLQRRKPAPGYPPVNEWERDQLVKQIRETRREDLADVKEAFEEMLIVRLAPYMDHEPRIRLLEKSRSIAVGAIYIVGSIGGIVGFLRLIGVIHG